MKLIKSPIQMINFWILNLELKTIKTEGPVKASELFLQYEVDIDFGLQQNGEYKLAFVKASINKGGSVGGYSILAEGVTRFKISDASLQSQADVNCVSIGIQNLRNYVESASANGQFGRYILPTINLGEMITEKNKQIARRSLSGMKKAKRTKRGRI